MADHEHYTGCHRHHMACALLKIWDLGKEVQRLTTQLQYERTGHLTPQVNIPTVWCSDLPSQEGVLATTPLPAEPVYVSLDHIEPPIVSGGPTWASRNDEPPSFTP